MIRLATERDAPACLRIYAPIIAETVTSFEIEAPAVEEMARRIADTLIQYPWLVLEGAGEVQGYAYGGLHRKRPAYQWSVEVSVYVAEAARGKGVGRRLYTELFDLLRRQGYVTAFAGITLPNDASVGLHEAMGFRPIGVFRNIGFKLGRWLDVGWWQRELTDLPAQPAPPLPIADLTNNPENPMAPTTIDEYIAAFPPEVQSILERVRTTIKEAAPAAEEKISYRMPTFTLKGPLVYFGAFKKHIGFYPPVRDEALRREASIYAGEKGNLQFPLDKPMPYALITKIVKARVRENQEAEGAKRKKKQA